MTGAVLDTDDIISESRIGFYQIMVGVLGACILLVDGFNTQVIGYIAPQIAQHWHLSRDVLGWVLAADKFGLFMGYLFVAPLSGRYGHKRVAIACITLFGTLALLTTAATNVPELFSLRFLTGIGLGGALPSGVALTGEYFPRGWRSTSITFIYFGLSFGQLSSGEVSNAVLGPYGWQAALAAGGGLALLLAATLALLMPESLEYLVNRAHAPGRARRILGRIAPTRIIPSNVRLVAGARDSAKLTLFQLLPRLFRDGRAFGTAVIWFTLGMNLIVNTSLQTWLTKILIDEGFGQHIAIIATEMSFAAGLFAAFIIGPLMDRIGPYRVIAALFLGSALFSTGLGLALSWKVAFVIAAASFASGFCTSGVQKGGNALCIYFYPTALRSTGLGWGLGIGRIGAILGPLAVGFLLTLGWSSSAVFTATALPALLGAGAILLMGRRYGAPTQSRPDAEPHAASTRTA